MPTRRQFLAHSATLAAAAALAPHCALAADDNKKPAVRAITRGPRHHWFGYYDKLQFDPTNRYVLGMEVDFEHRSPKPGDEIRLGIIDLEDGDKWREIGTSRAWCWQQGCMLQWLPGSQIEVIAPFISPDPSPTN